MEKTEISMADIYTDTGDQWNDMYAVRIQQVGHCSVYTDNSTKWGNNQKV